MARSLPLMLVAISSLGLARPAISPAQVGGVYIDPKGMLRETSSLAPDERLQLLRLQHVGQGGGEVAGRSSALRKISLRRLEAVVRRHHRQNVRLPAEVRFLAGLTHLRYVFFDPAANDVILAGPAEGWKQLPTGEVVGRQSGRPVLPLEELIVALRYAFTERARPPFIGCSIDPTPEGLKNYAAYLRSAGRIDRSRLPQILAGMARAMGPQQVRIFGIDPGSRFAVTLVAADYRLKRIAMGHDPSPVQGVVNYLDLAARRSISARQPQHRWWFVARYDALQHTPDGNAWELVGQGVRVSTAPTSAGTKNRPRKAAPAARQFAELFTKHFPALSRAVPVFAALENDVSLAVAAEIIARRYYGSAKQSARYRPSHLADRAACPVPRYSVPRLVPSLVSYRRGRNRQWLISVSGGVEINPTQLVKKTARAAEEKSELPALQKTVRLPAAETRWWWD